MMNLRVSIPSVFILTGIFAGFFLLYSGLAFGQSPFNKAGNDSILMDLAILMKEKQQLVQKTGEGVVMVVAYDATGTETGRGSGFFIDREGHIITNASFLKDAYSAEVISESHSYHDVIILKRDPGMDIALMHVKTTDEVSLTPDYAHRISSGERVYIVGRSSDSELTYSEGIIKSVNTPRPSMELMEIQTIVSLSFLPAGKDGPLLNEEGIVIGVTGIQVTPDQSNDGIQRMTDDRIIKAVSMNTIQRFLSKTDSPEHLHHARTRILSQWLVTGIKTAAKDGFIALYTIGLSKILQSVFLIVMAMYVLYIIYLKLKKGLFNKY